MGRGLILTSVFCLLSGCALFPDKGQSTFCDAAEPFTPSSGFSERWTRSEKVQALGHNRVGKALCGWGSKKKKN